MKKIAPVIILLSVALLTTSRLFGQTDSEELNAIQTVVPFLTIARTQERGNG
jgi:hypothetical protein